MTKRAKSGRRSGLEASGTGSQLRQDALVDKLVPDPSQHGQLVVIFGFLGKGAQEGIWRLYLTPQLDEYVEFPARAIAHSQAIPREQSPFGGTHVWLRPDVNLKHTLVSSRQVQADFLQGGITTDYLGATTPSMPNVLARRAAGAAGTHNYVCSTNPHIPVCQIHSENCHSSYFSCEAPDPGSATCPTGHFIKGC